MVLFHKDPQSITEFHKDTRCISVFLRVPLWQEWKLAKSSCFAKTNK